MLCKYVYTKFILVFTLRRGRESRQETGQLAISAKVGQGGSGSRCRMSDKDENRDGAQESVPRNRFSQPM
jgi:hypothetical protein